MPLNFFENFEKGTLTLRDCQILAMYNIVKLNRRRQTKAYRLAVASQNGVTIVQWRGESAVWKRGGAYGNP